MDSAEIQRLHGIIHSYTVFFIIFDIVFFAIILGAVGLLIRYLKSQERLRSSGDYLRYIIRGQEEERARVARELHDTVAQDLRYCRSLSEKIHDKKDPELGPSISSLLEKTLSQVRSMSYNLAPPDVIRNDITANVMNLSQNFKEHSDIEFRLTMPEKIDTSFLSEEDNLNIYRIVQEALTNILKHAQASEVTILLRNANEGELEGIYIFISDDGIGFEVSELGEARGTDGSHLGLVGMRERADFIGAKLEIDSHPDEGTQITLIKQKV